MSDNSLPLIITVSRQLGSGGAYLGQRIASEFSLSFYDREIINRAAKSLLVSGEELE